MSHAPLKAARYRIPIDRNQLFSLARPPHQLLLHALTQFVKRRRDELADQVPARRLALPPHVAAQRARSIANLRGTRTDVGVGDHLFHIPQTVAPFGERFAGDGARAETFAERFQPAAAVAVGPSRTTRPGTLALLPATIAVARFVGARITRASGLSLSLASSAVCLALTFPFARGLSLALALSLSLALAFGAGRTLSFRRLLLLSLPLPLLLPLALTLALTLLLTLIWLSLLILLRLLLS